MIEIIDNKVALQLEVWEGKNLEAIASYEYLEAALSDPSMVPNSFLPTGHLPLLLNIYKEMYHG